MTSAEKRFCLELCGIGEVVAAISPSPHATALLRKCDELKQRIIRAKKSAPEKPNMGPTRRQAKQTKHAAKKAEWNEIKAFVIVRSGGRCEVFDCRLPMHNVDHWLGGSGRRLKEQRVETCWALCKLHDDNRTLNWPSAAKWNREYEKHCKRYGYEFIPHKERAP